MIKSLALTVCLVIPALSISISVMAASVFKVTNGKNTLYIGGTVHILSSDNLPLPTQYAQAYAASDKLVFETDIEGTKSPDFQQKLMSKVMLTDGSTLQTRLDETTYLALQTYLEAKGLPIDAFQTMKPAMVALTITVMSYQEQGFDQEGVDTMYANQAKSDGKPIEWFESIDEQIDFIVNLGGDDDNALINYTLNDIEALPMVIDGMLLSWKRGDLEKLNDTVIKEMAASSPAMYDLLIVERNNNWMPNIIQMLEDEPIEFILVGVAHLAGKDSIFAALEAQGYHIEKLQ